MGWSVAGSWDTRELSGKINSGSAEREIKVEIANRPQCHRVNPIPTIRIRLESPSPVLRLAPGTLIEAIVCACCVECQM